MKNFKKYILFIVLLIGILQSFKFVLKRFWEIPDASDTHLMFNKKSFFEVDVAECYINRDYDSLVIPSKVLIDYNICDVTGIADEAFRKFKSKDTINLIIPSSIKSIGERAFENCNSLKSVVIPSSVTYVKADAFKNCKNLSRVELQNSGVGCFRANPFEGCTNLTDISIATDNPNYSLVDGVLYNKSKSVIISAPAYLSGSFEIPSTVETIGIKAFSECKNLSKVKIPSSVKTIESDAFKGCVGLDSIEIPSSVTKINSNAFYQCSGLKSIVFQSAKEKIDMGEKVFAECTGLKSVTISDRLERVEDGMFYGCTGLEEVLMPSTIDEIGSKAFYGCEKLANVVLSNRLSSISDWAFNGCVALTNIKIPNSVREIGYLAFDGCVNLNVEVDGKLKDKIFVSRSSFAGSKSVKFKDDYSDDVLDDTKVYELSETPLYFKIISKTSVEVINDKSYGSLTEIVVPAKVKIDDKVYNVTRIASSAFYGCEMLSKVYIPSSVKQIGTSAFFHCYYLDVTINNSMSNVSVSEYAFDECQNVHYLKL